jgi:hypothetical protein
MKLVCLLIFISLGTLTMNVKGAQDNQLSQYYWENRVLITTIASEQELTSLEQQLQKLWPEFEERKLIVFAIYKERSFELTPQSSYSKQNIEEITKRLNNRHTLLIGLDGGSKAVYDSFDSKQIFADIDAMPMRRSRLEN